MLKLIGDVEGFVGKIKDRMVKLTGEGADAQYLTWNQVPDTVKFEADTLTNMASKTIDIVNDKVSTAVTAVEGGIWSTREGILFAGNAERVEEELAGIKEEQATKNTPIGKTEQNPAA